LARTERHICARSSTVVASGASHCLASPKADNTFCARWRRMVAGPQTARRGKAGAPRSLRSWAPAFPFSEGPCSLGWGVSIIGLLARVLHDARHGSRVTSDTASRRPPARPR
jgi:hypothetical protein